MDLFYCDESNLQEKSGDFFVYGGLLIPGDAARGLSEDVDRIRKDFRVPKQFRLKFNPGPDHLKHNEFIDLKKAVSAAAIDRGVTLLVSTILHDIATSAADARLNAINTVCYHFDCLLARKGASGLVLIDRFTDNQIDEHLAEKFSVGVKGLPFSSEKRLSNILGFHYSAVGQSNFASLIDIVLGSLRFVINCYSRKKADNPTAKAIMEMVAPLIHRERDSKAASELGMYFSPKTVTVQKYKDHYRGLQAFLRDSGLETAQKI